MQPLQQGRRVPSTDDFDMAKLQKSLKQQHRQSLRLRNSITKLSPAEIRSLNNSIAASKGSRRSSSPPNSNKANSNTPPLTPDNGPLNHHAPSNRDSLSIPTPPQSPDNDLPQRRSSDSRNGTHIYSPIPQSHNKAGFVFATNNSRPPSASSHRAMPTYRGPEVTKTGPFAMYQQAILAHQIIDNPLSQFSRPRQSRGSVSPTRQEQRQRTPSEYSETRSYRSQSLPVVTTSVSRSTTPPALSRSPVSAIEDIPVFEPSVRSTSPSGAVLDRVQTVAVDGPISKEQPSRFSWHWRRNQSTPRNSSEENEAPKKLRKRSFSWSKTQNQDVPSVAYESTKSGLPPQGRDSLKGDLPSNKTSVYVDNGKEIPVLSDEFIAHPAVRPLSTQSDAQHESTQKGKGRLIENAHEQQEHDLAADDSIPMYSRCSCCGRLRKPPGNRSLSPVLENENLRTNFSMEIDRVDQSAAGHRKSGSSADRPKSTPIIPMVLEEGSMVQAKIAAVKPESVSVRSEPVRVINPRGDIIESGSEPIVLVPKVLEDSQDRPSRFASLRYGEEPARQINNYRRFSETYNIKRNVIGRNSMPPMPTNRIVEHQPEPTIQSQQLDESHPEPDLKLNSDHIAEVNGYPKVSEEATGELMAAMSGVEMPVELSNQSYTEGMGQMSNKEGFKPPGQVKEALVPALPQQNTTEPGVALTSDEAVLQSPRVSAATSQRSNPKSVTFDPASIEQKESGESHGSSSVYQKSRVRNVSAPAYPSGATSTYVNYSTRGFVTKPKGTAQYLYQTKTGPQPSAAPQASIAYQTQFNRSNLKPSTGSEFDSSTVPTRLPQTSESTGDWDELITSAKQQQQSNLVESVLVATGHDFKAKDHDVQV